MLEAGLDQAAGLRRLLAPPPLDLLAFPLGRAAPLHWVARIAHLLRRLGCRPVVVDGARGALAASFGLRPRHELLELLQDGRPFDAVASATPDGIHVVRADAGLDAFVASGEPSTRLLGAFAALSHGFDELLLAMPAGELASLADPARSVPVIGLAGGRAGLMDSYAVLKQLADGFGYRRFACVATGAADEAQASQAQARLAAAAARFLGVEVRLAGWLPAHGGAGEAIALRTAQALLQLTAAPAD